MSEGHGYTYKSLNTQNRRFEDYEEKERFTDARSRCSERNKSGADQSCELF